MFSRLHRTPITYHKQESRIFSTGIIKSVIKILLSIPTYPRSLFETETNIEIPRGTNSPNNKQIITQVYKSKVLSFVLNKTLNLTCFLGCQGKEVRKR